MIFCWMPQALRGKELSSFQGGAAALGQEFCGAFSKMKTVQPYNWGSTVSLPKNLQVFF